MPMRFKSLAVSVLLVTLVLSMGPALVQGVTTPTVSISSPAADSVYAGNVSVKGHSSGATSVEVRIDSEVAWRSATGTIAWNYTWDPKGYSTGYHNIYARALNGTSVSENASVRIYLNNTPPNQINMDVSAVPLDIAPLGNVTVSGFVDYNTGMPLRGSTITIAIISTQVSATATTDDKGYFIKNVAGPADPGGYTLRVSVDDGKLTNDRDFSLSVSTPNQPDLSVKIIELDPPAPTVGVTVSICATIENLGISSASVTVKFTLDGSYLESKVVHVDRKALVKTLWVAEFGSHTIKVELSGITPADKDPSNNQLTKKITSTAEPDVVIDEIIMSNPSLHQGQAATVMVKLENKGYSATTGTLTLYDGNITEGKSLGAKDVALDANGTAQGYFTWSPLQGLHILTAHVEITGQTAHPGQTKTLEVTVLPKVKTKEQPTPFPGAGSMILVLVAVAFIIMRWKRDTR
jgi:hypothetical protein